MIEVVELLHDVRFALKDVSEARYSDFDLIRALNRAIQVVSEKLNEIFSPLLEREVFISERSVDPITAGLIELPDDFASIVFVEDPLTEERLEAYDGFEVVGTCVKTECPVLRLRYRRTLPRVKDSSDKIDLPAGFFYVLCDVVAAEFKGDSTLLSKALYDIRKLEYGKGISVVAINIGGFK